jgi:hypothetical protein
VELRGFEPLTSAVQAPARGDGAPPLPFRRAYCRSRAAGSGPRPALLPLPYAPPVRRTPRRSRENCWVACRRIKTVQAAIDRAKKIAGAEDDSAALAIICEDYAEGRTTLTPDWLVETLADYLSSLDADERTKFRAAVNARVTPVAAPQAG